jgi:hypothetical protein
MKNPSLRWGFYAIKKLKISKKITTVVKTYLKLINIIKNKINL